MKPDGFLSAGPAVNFRPHAKRAFIAAYERRLDQEVTHPVLEQKSPVGRLPFLQARIMARHLRGDLPNYVPCVLKN